MVLRCDQTNITKSVSNAYLLLIKHIQAIDEMILSYKLVFPDRIAQCFILLNRSVPAADVCCFRNNLTEMNSNINVSVVGQIETVG